MPITITATVSGISIHEAIKDIVNIVPSISRVFFLMITLHSSDTWDYLQQLLKKDISIQACMGRSLNK